MFCHAPTMRRQTAGAGESCWMLQSLVASRFDNAFVLDVIQGTVRDILSGRHHFSLIFMWPCHGPREGLGLLWAFKVQLSLLCLRLLGPLNNFTSRFSLVFSHLQFFSPLKSSSLKISPVPSLFASLCLIYLQPLGSCSPVLRAGYVWFSSHVVKKNMEPKSGHT